MDSQTVTLAPLLNLHEVLSDAKFEAELPQQVRSFRVEDETFAGAKRICDANGASVSAFVRQCLRTLVREYQQP